MIGNDKTYQTDIISKSLSILLSEEDNHLTLRKGRFP